MGVKIKRKIKPKIIGLIIVAKIIPNFIHNLFKIKRQSGKKKLNRINKIAREKNITYKKNRLAKRKYDPITKKTKAIMVVNWSGRPCELDKIHILAKRRKIKLIQDACHCIDAKFKNNSIVKYSDACTFSLHPLKNLNVWGDGGFILTNNKLLAKKLYIIRNHGLVDRNNCEIFAYNSRLDSIQAAIANYKIKNKLNTITNKRIRNAKLMDKLLKPIHQVKIPVRKKYLKEVFHLYQINVKDRDKLINFLVKKNIDAKVHYPIPIHLQKAAKSLKYKKGDFPIAERMANTSVSLPVHEFISENQVKYFN